MAASPLLAFVIPEKAVALVDVAVRHVVEFLQLYTLLSGFTCPACTTLTLDTEIAAPIAKVPTMAVRFGLLS
jgi:hypothetical protein